jgi:transaldolase/glucose-6-phosphate isomerase
VASPAPAPVRALFAAGQSIWLDFIRKGLLDSGELADMVERGLVSGLTSNPTIFEKAIGGSADYDGAFEALALTAPDAFAVYDALSIDDIRRACDVLRPVWERTQGVDGYASIEVQPHLAHDTAATLAEARRLHAAVGRPNVLVKIPATDAGLPAIRAAIAEGISINITLIFAVERYEQVVEAYLSGLEALVARAGDPRPVASVASFFVSRVDTLVDPLLAGIAADPRTASGLAATARELEGAIAVANARVAYGRFRALFSGPRWEALAAKGARVQRPLWASTGTKNKAYSDVKYVEELAGPDTVNTMPPETLAAFGDHGKVAPGLDETHVTAAQAVLRRLAGTGLSLAEACEKLERDGVRAFAASFDALLAGIEARRQAVRAMAAPRFASDPGAFEAALRARLEGLAKDRFAARLDQRDASLWSADPAVQASIGARLGWLDAPGEIGDLADDLRAFAAEIAAEGLTDAVVLGMGGSSLCPALLARTFPPAPGRLRLHVLDSTDPAGVLRLRAAIDPAKTLFIVSTKSGTTTETLAFADYFAVEAATAIGPRQALRHFVAITDPDSPLEARALREGWRRVFLAPSDVGGRYSALTVFGLVPAALLGIDLEAFATAAQAMAAACGPRAREAENPGLVLGTILGEAARAGRDKLTLVLEPPFAALGGWLEQLVAESTGKDGTGIVPVAGEPLAAPAAYGADRIFVRIGRVGLGDAGTEAALDELAAAGHPVVRLGLDDANAIAGEFVRWEVATATAAALLGVNPFDEPNVSESKANTARALARFEAGRPLGEEPAIARASTLAAFAPGPHGAALAAAAAAGREGGHAGDDEILAGVLEAHLATLAPGDAWSLLAYLEPTATEEARLQDVRRLVRDRARVATALGGGPRYLHSTGQLHKGGPAAQAFLVLTFETIEDCVVPGMPWSFGVLCDAQAAGDVEALAAHGRRVLRIHLEGPRAAALAALAGLAERAASIRAPA